MFPLVGIYGPECRSNATIISLDFFCHTCEDTCNIEMFQSQFNAGIKCGECGDSIPAHHMENYTVKNAVIQRNFLPRYTGLMDSTNCEFKAKTTMSNHTGGYLIQVGDGTEHHQSDAFVREATFCMECGLPNDRCVCCHAGSTLPRDMLVGLD